MLRKFYLIKVLFHLLHIYFLWYLSKLSRNMTYFESIGLIFDIIYALIKSHLGLKEDEFVLNVAGRFFVQNHDCVVLKAI